MTTTLIAGGRVIDPETGLDGNRDVELDGDRVTAVAEPGALNGADRTVDATGCIVAPGFVDLHCHAQSLRGNRLQAFDGVTTTLELEAGASPVAGAYAVLEAKGRLLNFGFSASWALARMEVVAGQMRGPGLNNALAGFGNSEWEREASPAQIDRILALLEEDLAAGAIGIGLLVGYAQGASIEEYQRVARLAAAADRPTFTHARDLVEVRPDVLIDGAEEITRAAAETGAHMHYCHMNSTSARHVERVMGLVGRTVSEGAHVTTEAYPYGAGMTGIGAAFLDPERLAGRGLQPSSLVMAATGERIAHADRLLELRAEDAAALVVVETLDEADPAQYALIMAALTAPGGSVASDGMEPTRLANGHGHTTHPRTAGTFARALRTLTDNAGESWIEAIQRCTLNPVRTLESAVPAMRRKGRVQVGCDADIVVFDPTTLRDRATYGDPMQTSEGVRHLFVNGEPLIADGTLNEGLRPGRAVRA